MLAGPRREFFLRAKKSLRAICSGLQDSSIYDYCSFIWSTPRAFAGPLNIPLCEYGCCCLLRRILQLNKRATYRYL